MTGSQNLSREAFDRISREIEIYETATRHKVTAVTIHEGTSRGRKQVTLATTSPEGVYAFDTTSAGDFLVAT